MSEVGNADTIHGRLLEAIHISGYSLERAVKELEWLLEEERWRLCGPGYEEIDKFLATIHLDGFTKNIEQRKGIVKKLSELRATQRAIGGALGVSEATVNRDINPVTDVTKTEGEARQDKELEAADVQRSICDDDCPTLKRGTDGNRTGWVVEARIASCYFYARVSRAG